jgi:hypothetical protein
VTRLAQVALTSTGSTRVMRFTRVSASTSSGASSSNAG